MTATSPDAESLWLSCAADMAAAGKAAVQTLYGRAAGRVDLGQGAGGDRTLQIDRACEEAIEAVLRERAPFPHRLVSEESGISGPEDAPWWVVVDPLDGSLNAKRGLGLFGASIAVADGDTLGNARVAYIEDFLRPQVFSAVKGRGVIAAGGPGETLDAHRFESDVVEMVLLEAKRPDRHDFRFQDLAAVGGPRLSDNLRVRQLGSIALALAYVAVGVADIMVAAVQSRSVDLAAGLLILAEAGGGAAALVAAAEGTTASGAALADTDILAQPLDLGKRFPFVAWRAGLDGREIVARARRLGVGLIRPQ